MSTVLPRFCYTTAPELATPPRGLKSFEPPPEKIKELLAQPVVRRMEDYRKFTIHHKLPERDPALKADPPEAIRYSSPSVAPEIHAAAVELGRRGGAKGGKARAARLSPEERTRIAIAAAKKRWADHQKKMPPLPTPMTPAQLFVARHCRKEPAP